MKILVTGGTGYIGSHTSVELMNQGFEIVIIDNLSNSNIKVLDGIKAITGIRPEFEKLDLCQAEALDNFFKKNDQINAIIHFAAYKAVGESVENPIKYYHNNLVSLLNLLQAMKKYQVPFMVFSSSCTVYGEARELPVTENSPVQPAESPYGNTKQIAEEILHEFVNSQDKIQAVALRYFNPIGAHPSSHIGELPIGEPENLVPYITQTGIGLRDHLNIFGNDYETPDGTAVRDYLHVVDLAKAHVATLKRLLSQQNKKPYEVFNLGMGKGVSVLEMIQSFNRVSGKTLNYKLVDRRQGDIEKIWADTSLATKELGWKTESSLDEAMKTAWDWEKRLNEKQS
ncbi:MAG: UDP-glucose 4-epimerase GalE [Bacteroidota bacterium]|nr:UDP-glucose 4-epimerase GalE [Bacteroidota bacterium]